MLCLCNNFNLCVKFANDSCASGEEHSPMVLIEMIKPGVEMMGCGVGRREAG